MMGVDVVVAGSGQREAGLVTGGTVSGFGSNAGCTVSATVQNIQVDPDCTLLGILARKGT